MSPRLRRAVLLALACASSPVSAFQQASASAPASAESAPPANAPAAAAPAATTAPRSEPLIPILVTEPAAPPPATGTPVFPELLAPAAAEPAAAPATASEASPPPTSPAAGRELRRGGDLFSHLRGRLSPNSCEAGSNSARWRARYAGHPATFSRRIESVLPLLDFVSAEVERAGLPGEFTFIPLVESWYQPGALGPGGPAGMWQMIASTARNHGIHIREGYDGRLSPVESTRAALSYLHTLQGMFGDWQAIVMAYNAGEGRLQNAFRRARSHVTSATERRPHGLSNITYDYVAKLQALSCLVLQPERAGLRLPVEARYEPLVPQMLDEGMDTLDAFAQGRGRDGAELRRLNPGFRNGRVIAGVPRMVLAPAGARPPPAPVVASESPEQMLVRATEEAEFAELMEQALVADDAAADASMAGDGSELLVSAAGDTVAQVVVGFGGPASRPADVAPPPATLPVSIAAASTTTPAVHEVRQGESLISIAQFYHLPVEQLRRANKLDDKATVRAGQVLQLVP